MSANDGEKVGIFKLGTASQARNYLIIISFLLLLVTSVSLYTNLSRAGTEYEALATMTGRTFFKAIVAMRQWNSDHGGVYVVIDEKAQPNPYLEDPLRDILTVDGMKLTKVNPAYMTRFISQYLNKNEGIELHITSLKPLNPSNKADFWEEEALRKFEKGNSEESGKVLYEGTEFFRYMAPLVTKESCLQCHAKQGYKIGEVRGGISVSFPYSPYKNAITLRGRKIVINHTLFFITGLIIIWVLGRRLVNNISQLQKTLIRINKLEGILPICSSCKKIRDNKGDWNQLEIYIKDHSEAEFSHGLCPQCAEKLYPDYYKPKKNQ